MSGERPHSRRLVAATVGVCLVLIASALALHELGPTPTSASGNAGLRLDSVSVLASYSHDCGNGVSSCTTSIAASTGNAVWVFVAVNAPNASFITGVQDSNSNSFTKIVALNNSGNATCSTSCTPAIFFYVLNGETASASSVTATGAGGTAISMVVLVLTGVSGTASVAAHGSGRYTYGAASVASAGDAASSPSASDPYFLFYGVSANSGTIAWAAAGGSALVTGTTGSNSNIAVGAFEQNFSSSGSNTIVGSGSGGTSSSNWYRLAVVAAAGGPPVPAAPSGLHVTSTTTTSVSLAWTAPSGTVVNYTVEFTQGTCPVGASPTHKSVGNSTTSYTVSSLASSAEFCFAVQAWNSTGGGAFSSGVEAGTWPFYGYYEKTYSLPGFNPLTGYLKNWGGGNAQVPTLSSSSGQPVGIYYVDNSSDLDLLYLSNGTSHAVAHVVLLYQTYSSYNEMLDNEFFIEYGYDQALFFGTTTSGGSTYSIELVNLTSGAVRIWNTSAAVDAINQQPDYVGNNTVIVMSSNNSILAWNLASHKEWSAGTLAFFEANNAYWFPQKRQIVNVEAAGSSSDQVQQLNATYNGQGEVQFASVATVAVDSGKTFNWVNGLDYNATTGKIAFTAGYWVGSAVYTYIVPYASTGLLTTTGLTKVPVYTGGADSGKDLDVQRYVYTSDYVLGQASGTGWTNTTQPLYDPWNGSLLATNRSLDTGVNGCANNCFEGQYAPDPAYQIDYNATVQLNNPMYRVVYAYHNASQSSPSGSPTLTISPTSGYAGTVVTLSGTGYSVSTQYTYCFAEYAAACSSGSAFTSTGGGAIPSGTTIDAPSPPTPGNFVDVSQGTVLVVDAPFTLYDSGGGGGGSWSGAPSGLSATAGLSCAVADLSWTNPTPPAGDVTNDTVYVYLSAGPLFQVVDSGKLATSLSIPYLDCGQTYVFKVRAWDTAGASSPLSDGVTFTTASLPAAISNPTGATPGSGSGLSSSVLWIVAAVVGAFLLALLLAALAASRGRRHAGRQLR